MHTQGQRIGSRLQLMEVDCRLPGVLQCVAVVCYLLAAAWPRSADAQLQRVTTCLAGQRVEECITCSSNITVHPSTGRGTGTDCGPLLQSSVSLNGKVCSQLAHAIDSIAAGHTTPQQGDCIAVYVYPTESGAPYIIPAAPGNRAKVIASSVVILGVSADEQHNNNMARPATASTTPGHQRQPQVCVVSTPPPLHTPNAIMWLHMTPLYHSRCRLYYIIIAAVARTEAAAVV